MKKIAALALLASVSGLASAQSSVTLFGIVDAGVRYVKNGDEHVYSTSSNGMQTSRFGFRGVEDLGDGMKAGFWLESGFSPDTGSSSDSTRLFNRRSTVSLSTLQLGEIRIGRDTSPNYNGYVDYDVYGANGVGAADKFVNTFGTDVATTVRADNLVSYFTPGNLGGFYGQLTVAPGEGQNGKKYQGGRAGYATGPFDISGSYGSTTVAPVNGGDDKYKFGTIAAAYDFKVVKFSGYVSQVKYTDEKEVIVNIGALVPLGQGTLRASYINANASGNTPTGVNIDGNDAQQVALGYIYDFSKRTAIYSTVSRVNNKNAASYVVDSNPALKNPNNGGDSTGFEVGIRHRF